MAYESGLIAEFYDGDYAAFRTPSGDVAFYVEEGQRSGGPVLELACGTGRVLLPIARAGVEIVGVDLSGSMLEKARAALAGETAAVRARVTLHEGDLRGFVAGRTFPLVTIPFRPIAHLLDTASQLAAFRNARSHLAPGGRLVFDFFHPDPRFLMEPRPERLDLERQEGTRRIRRFSTATPHLASQTTEVTFRWEIEEIGGGRREERISFAMRWYHRFELEHLLARCGLEVETLYGDFGRGPFRDDSKEMLFVARASP
ncbi:MAG: class I SAM-dependent methyltransferase [Planctomycetaceae bacterium]